jgi:hypothetical protein
LCLGHLALRDCSRYPCDRRYYGNERDRGPIPVHAVPALNEAFRLEPIKKGNTFASQRFLAGGRVPDRRGRPGLLPQPRLPGCRAASFPQGRLPGVHRQRVVRRHGPTPLGEAGGLPAVGEIEFSFGKTKFVLACSQCPSATPDRVWRSRRLGCAPTRRTKIWKKQLFGFASIVTH